ncbi:MAG TPA: phosphodiester glycosidase family protein [Candidatus Rubrimentiphilum sp.]|nr:phosphodiester glycosidase family protein [Candidatus Rubrimentiphilum sp.]
MALIAAIALAALLPRSPHPATPFPLILTDAVTIAEIAPGVAYGDYEMLTADGPLSIHVVAIDLTEPTVRVGTVLAQDHIVSQGEPVSSMAQRSRAVAGINGDYFDINQTNAPLNILVQDGRLERMPSHRWAVAIDANKAPRFAEFTLAPVAQIGTAMVPIATINDWPPGGRTILTMPEFGALRPAPNVTELQLQPVTGDPPFATYRVTGIADNSVTQPPGYYLSIGPAEYGTFPLPNTGDAISIVPNAGATLAGVQTAIGGGPLLVQNGRPYADPDGPSGGEFASHIPASGVAATTDGRLLFFQIDGRQPDLSIGVLQTQLAALMIAFGANTGMQFDGGGSSAIVARLPGSAAAGLVNSPSDGHERSVADGLFVYSDAPAGFPSRVVAWPPAIRAFPGANVDMHLAAVDPGDHVISGGAPIRVDVRPAGLGRFAAGKFLAGNRAGSGVLRVKRGELRLDVPVAVTTAVARVRISPRDPVVAAGGSVRLSILAFDRDGFPIALPDALPWRAQDGTIDKSGNFRAGKTDATVTLQLGSALATQRIMVGEHEAPLSLASAVFASAPRGGPGQLVPDPDPTCNDCLILSYDFSGTERAAYASASIALPQRVLAIGADINGDGNGEALRVAVNNAINERFMYTIAHIDWRGWRHVQFRFPPSLAQPLTLKAIYTINRVGSEIPVTAAGSVGIRNVRMTLAGGPHQPPK